MVEVGIPYLLLKLAFFDMIDEIEVKVNGVTI
jgi:hypothetical protein